MIISLLSSERDNKPEQVELDWPGLVSLLTTEFIRTESKFGSPAWCPVEFSPAVRKKENARAIGAAVFDFDALSPADFSAMVAKLDASGLAAVVHTSFSHTPEKPKARAVFKLSRLVLSGEWLTVWNAIPRMLDLKVNADPACKDPSRLYFLPCAKPEAPTFAGTTDGTEAIDVDALLSYAAKAKFEQAVEAKLNNAPASSVLIPATDEADDKTAVVRADGSVNMAAIRTVARHMGLSSDVAVLNSRVLKGEALASKGGRDDALNRYTGAITFALPSETPTAAIVEFMRPSIALMDPPEPGSRFPTWFEFATDMIDRARERKRIKDAQYAVYVNDVRARLMLESSKSAAAIPEAESNTIDGEPTTVQPYSEAQLTRWGIEQGVDDLMGFDRRWIIQKGTSYYVFVEGQYSAPIVKDELQTSFQRDLARTPLQLTKETKVGSGEFIPRTVRELLDDYSTVARHVEASLALQLSYYDPKVQTFFEAVTPLRRLKPTNHPEIQRWLELLGGKDAEKLIDWVASSMRLDRQSCAIYLDGKSGAGKNLLASGLARLWTTGGPSELGRVLEGFNESLIRCPLVFADEALPQRKGITAELRRFIGSTSRTLNRKFIPACNLDGAVRVIIAGNNKRLLDTGEELSANDIEAVAGRFLYIAPSSAPVDYLIELGGPPYVGKWITEDRIAEHAHYLRTVREVREDGRFLVEGEGSEFHDRLATSTGMAGLVCEWLVRYLAKKNTETQKNTLMLVGAGELWVNTEALAGESSWTAHLPAYKVPTAASISRALSNLAVGSIKVKLGDQTLSYHRLKIELVLSWAQQAQIGDIESIERRLRTPNPAISEALLLSK